MYLPTTVFVDLSNIFYGAQESVVRKSALQPLRLQHDALLALSLGGHPLERAIAVTTQRQTNGAALDAAERAGFQLLRSEPGAFSGREQNVDERLQLEMYIAARRAPARVVLLTGDGRGGDEQTPSGFVPAVEVLADSGARVELLAWERSCSSALRRAVQAAGGVVNFLDPFALSVTFEPSGRCAAPLNLRRRRHLPTLVA